MIRAGVLLNGSLHGKPRASGDDPPGSGHNSNRPHVNPARAGMIRFTAQEVVNPARAGMIHPYRHRQGAGPVNPARAGMIPRRDLLRP